MRNCFDDRFQIVVWAWIVTLPVVGCQQGYNDVWLDDSQVVLMAEPTATVATGQPMASSMIEPEPVMTDPMPVQEKYAIRRGDTLWSIAQRSYGDGKRWRDILAANPGLDPTRLRVGQQIVLP